ncbi:MAG: DUF72 domain-containing protein [Candidatus Lokiarchaeota archaeon]|nr:DUF72 domain-containing protein [Candidatus Lokiarchaeota archaeon]
MVVAERADRVRGPRYHVGCSGWSYDGWRGTFYPGKLPQSKWLEYYASVFDVVEVDSTFYTMPRPEVVRRWHDVTPGGFRFVAKLFKGITHDLHRAVAEKSLEVLVDRYFEGMAMLGAKLAATVIQLPPGFHAKHADDLLSLLNTLPTRTRHALEFRDVSWFENSRVMRTIEDLDNVSIAGSIHPAIDPFVKRTADFYVFRFIGDRELQWFGAIQRDRKEQMERVKRLMDAELQGVRDTFVFFNNHYAGFGPASVNLFRELAGLEPAGFGGAGKGQTTLGDFLK